MIDYLKKNDKSSSQIVQLRTKEQSLPLDYYLTQHDRPLSILHDKIVLLPYFKPQTMEKERHKPCLNDYEILAEIGKGGFSTVYLGTLTPYIVVDYEFFQPEEDLMETFSPLRKYKKVI